MRTQWSGANGRYQPRCENGVCALTGGRATSKLEGQIFTLLDHVVGPGEQDVRVRLDGRAARLDMVFEPVPDFLLVVEYDGAHWHEGKELQDSWKARAAGEAWLPRLKAHSVRLREAPLRPLTPHDVPLPPRADAAACTRLTLLHLFHTSPLGRFEAADRIEAFLRAGTRPLGEDQILCGDCWEVARHVLPAHLLAFRVRNTAWRAPPQPVPVLPPVEVPPPAPTKGFRAQDQPPLTGL